MESTIIDRKKRNQGMNWLSRTRRLAIYLRDGLACVYCQKGVEDGAKLTLDHLAPHSMGGSNHETNLVTCCNSCNIARGTKSYADFSERVAGYIDNGRTGQDIVRQIDTLRFSPLDKPLAAKMIKARGSVTKAIQPK